MRAAVPPGGGLSVIPDGRPIHAGREDSDVPVPRPLNSGAIIDPALPFHRSLMTTVCRFEAGGRWAVSGQARRTAPCRRRTSAVAILETLFLDRSNDLLVGACVAPLGARSPSYRERGLSLCPLRLRGEANSAWVVTDPLGANARCSPKATTCPAKEQWDPDSVVALIRAKGRVAAAIAADRRNDGFGRETVESPLPPLGGLDCLVHNASSSAPGLRI